MKRIVSLALILCFVFAGGIYAFAEEAYPESSKMTYEEKTDDGAVQVTVYNLSEIVEEYLPNYANEKTPEEIAAAETLNIKVSQRAQNAIVIQIGNYAAVANDLLEWIDKENKKVVPYIKENRTMVPLRYIAEKLGAEVGYDEEKREVSITLGEDIFKLVIEDTKYTLNGVEYALDAPAEIVEDRTFVPIRVISEAFKKKVAWIEAGKYVIVTPEFYPWDAENEIEKETLSRISLMVSPLVRDLAN